MLYGNGMNADFISSGVGVYTDDWYSSATRIIPMQNILASCSGFYYPTNVENALFVGKSSYYEDNKYVGTQVMSADGGLLDSYSISNSYDSELTTADFVGAWAYPNRTFPHYALYKCLNWWEFTINPTDISENPTAHANNFNSPNGGYTNAEFSAWKGMARHAIIANRGVTCTELRSDRGYIQFRITSTIGMPSYMGGSMLFSASDSFNENKLIGVGLKGLTQYGLGIGNGGGAQDIYYKLYRFTDKDGYFKSLGNNFYLYNDPHIISVKGENSTYGSEVNGPFSFLYAGPFFVRAGLSAAKYVDASHNMDMTLDIRPDSYIERPEIFTSISYLKPAEAGEPISAKPIGSLGHNLNSSFKIRLWDDNAKNSTYYSVDTCAPGFMPGSGYNSNLYLNESITEVEFGRAASALGSIIKYNNYCLTNLTAINGTWNYCNNVINLTGTGGPVFSGCTKLEKIPSSWDGLSAISYFGNIFEGCTALKAIPESFSGLKNVTYMGYAFKDCSSISSPLVSWGCEHATYIGNMFENCISLTAIPKDFIGLENVTYANSAFAGCTALKKMPNSWEGLNICNTTDSMFYNCKSITTIPQRWTGLASWDMDYMFKNCSSLSSIESWTNFPGGTICEIFINCTSLKKLPDSWEGFSATNCPSAFANCTSLTDIPDSWSSLSKNYTNPNYSAMFEGCTSLTGIPTTQEAWAGFGNGNIGRMFANCTSLTLDPKPIMDGLNRPGYGSQMFKGCVNMANTATYITQSAYSSYFI